ncbi:MAG: hypothetical protein KJS92_08330 [Bacteroidetes bacterium]|nr:hypothetical protein [Bacteroidota bacterium]
MLRISVNLFTLKHCSLFLLILISAVSSPAQSGREFDLGITASGKGIGFFFTTVKPYREGSKMLRSVELGNLRHPKEIDVINTAIPNSSAYVFGKVNRAYVLRGLVGFKHMIAERKDRKSIGIQAQVLSGLSLAYMAPVYVDLLYVDNTSAYYRPTRYNPELIPQFLIGGRSNFNYGLNEGQLIPGIHLRAGLLARWGNFRNDYKQIGCGIMLDAFSKSLPIMYRQEHKSVYSSFYLSFALGYSD